MHPSFRNSQVIRLMIVSDDAVYLMMQYSLTTCRGAYWPTEGFDHHLTCNNIETVGGSEAISQDLGSICDLPCLCNSVGSVPLFAPTRARTRDPCTHQQLTPTKHRYPSRHKSRGSCNARGNSTSSLRASDVTD